MCVGGVASGLGLLLLSHTSQRLGGCLKNESMFTSKEGRIKMKEGKKSGRLTHTYTLGLCLRSIERVSPVSLGCPATSVS